MKRNLIRPLSVSALSLALAGGVLAPSLAVQSTQEPTSQTAPASTEKVAEVASNALAATADPAASAAPAAEVPSTTTAPAAAPSTAEKAVAESVTEDAASPGVGTAAESATTTPAAESTVAESSPAETAAEPTVAETAEASETAESAAPAVTKSPSPEATETASSKGEETPQETETTSAPVKSTANAEELTEPAAAAENQTEKTRLTYPVIDAAPGETVTLRPDFPGGVPEGAHFEIGDLFPDNDKDSYHTGSDDGDVSIDEKTGVITFKQEKVPLRGSATYIPVEMKLPDGRTVSTLLLVDPDLSRVEGTIPEWSGTSIEDGQKSVTVEQENDETPPGVIYEILKSYVPEGWTVSVDEKGNITYTAPDGMRGEYEVGAKIKMTHPNGIGYIENVFNTLYNFDYDGEKKDFTGKKDVYDPEYDYSDTNQVNGNVGEGFIWQGPNPVGVGLGESVTIPLENAEKGPKDIRYFLFPDSQYFTGEPDSEYYAGWSFDIDQQTGTVTIRHDGKVPTNELRSLPLYYTYTLPDGTPYLSRAFVYFQSTTDDSGQPDNPGQPSEPGKPGNPGQPSTPGNPGQPGTPVNPGQPGQPSNPGNPGQPSNPGNPGQPSNPGQPGNPDQPGDTDSEDDGFSVGTSGAGDQDDLNAAQDPQQKNVSPQAQDDDQSSTLAHTGAEVLPLLLAGSAVAAAGVVMVWLGRRRRRA